jgi:predicted aldo/keto reductase-like oxidoreductase
MSGRHPFISRRAFVQQSGLLAGGMLLGAPAVAHAADPEAPVPPPGEWPKRVLGRTGVSVTTMTLGTAPMGHCKEIKPPEIAEVVKLALDQGINFIDTAPVYDDAEEGVGMALGKRRDDVFLATKVWADTLKQAEESLANSLKKLKTDCVDLLYYHSVGNRQIEGAMEPGGVFHWLVQQKKAGKCRFVGISAHHLPGRLPAFLETDEVDVLLVVINFVDLHTYKFEETVLPIARKHNTGIVAMKVFGGANHKAGSYNNPHCPPELDPKYLDLAVRYSLGVEGVATVNLGVHNKDQVLKNIQMVRAYQPLSLQESDSIAQLGQTLAAEWGPHFGPVA